MIRLMMIDDETEILKNLRQCIDWATWGIDLVAEATNAVEGREKALALRPDILICDIHMPRKDGLTFCSELKTLLPKLKVIILSGYNDPGYLHRALTLGVNEYLLKPAGIDSIVPAVLKLKNQIVEERSKDKEEYLRESLLLENLSALRLFLINSLLENPSQDVAQLQAKAEILGIPLDGPCYQTVLFSKRSENADAYKSEIQLDMDFWRLTQALESIQKKTLGSFFCEIETFKYFWLLNAADGQAAQQQAHRLIEALQLAFPKNASIAVGTLAHNVQEISSSYAHARAALYRSAWDEGSSVFYYKDPVAPCNIDQELNKLNKRIIDALIAKESTLCIELIARAFALCRETFSPLAPLQAICRHILLVTAPAPETESDISCFSVKEYRIEEMDSGNELEKWMIQQVLGYFQNRGPQSCLPIVNKAVRYIHMHYQSSITLQQLAKEFFISPNYLGRLFHQETGCKMSDYLNRFRIERAKEMLLKNPDLKTGEVAEAVGFTNYKYFLVCFAKYAGGSLREFRSSGPDGE